MYEASTEGWRQERNKVKHKGSKGFAKRSSLIVNIVTCLFGRVSITIM
jgi:hypothetical protein